jgi:hypothetical protein
VGLQRFSRAGTALAFFFSAARVPGGMGAVVKSISGTGGRVMSNRHSGLKFLTGAIAAVALSAMPAVAADLTFTKAPPPEPAPTLDIHGFFDVTFKNDYITPRGLLVTNTGLTTQLLSGIVFDLYKDPGGFINNFSISGGSWNDLWSEQHSPTVGPWNELDWFVEADVVFARDWRFGVQFIQFDSPPGNFRAESNVEFTLAYSDKGWGVLPISINPYAKLFWAVSGDSTVVVGDRGGTYDVELGIVPTLDLNKYGTPLVLTAPTWITVGPASFWNRGVTGCGPFAFSTCALSNAGVFSTGLKGTVPLAFIPARWGKWYADAGVQYYHLINDSLLLAQTFTGTASSYASAHRDVTVAFAGVGFGF